MLFYISELYIIMSYRKSMILKMMIPDLFFRKGCYGQFSPLVNENKTAFGAYVRGLITSQLCKIG